MLNLWFKLEGREVKEAEMMEAAYALDAPGGRRVALTRVGRQDVSTVFLGLDYSYGHGGRDPLAFETMVFGPGTRQKIQQRYRSYDAAELGHQRVVAELCAQDAWKAIRALKRSFDGPLKRVIEVGPATRREYAL